MDEVVMPFGKHQGCPLPEVPTGYLLWCLRARRCVAPALREAIDRELQRRGLAPQPRPEPPPAAWPSLVRRWYRQLALAYHPDHGGSAEAMKAINAAHDLLRKLLEEEAGRGGPACPGDASWRSAASPR